MGALVKGKESYRACEHRCASGGGSGPRFRGLGAERASGRSAMHFFLPLLALLSSLLPPSRLSTTCSTKDSLERLHPPAISVAAEFPQARAVCRDSTRGSRGQKTPRSLPAAPFGPPPPSLMARVKAPKPVDLMSDFHDNPTPSPSLNAERRHSAWSSPADMGVDTQQPDESSSRPSAPTTAAPSVSSHRASGNTGRKSSRVLNCELIPSLLSLGHARLTPHPRLTGENCREKKMRVSRRRLVGPLVVLVVCFSGIGR